MIVLDTNVLSEVLRPAPEHRVMAWLDAQPRASMFTSAVTQGEILYCIRLMPDGQRRKKLWDAAVAIFTDDFSGRVLSFDEDAASNYAEIAASRRAAGRRISQFDGVIASITRSRGATLATRNAKDFEGCGIEVVNPWVD
jgi:predicted nucleic acid-binding protein